MGYPDFNTLIKKYLVVLDDSPEVEKSNLIMKWNNKKKAFEKTPLSQEEMIRGSARGELKEPVPVYNELPGDKVLQGRNTNSWIVLGRDRTGPGNPNGYGDKGFPACSMIDLVVGRGGRYPYDGMITDPVFKESADYPRSIPDAARIYMSQRTDIDKAFGISGENSVSRSGIGIKADAVRVIGTEGIKLVTNVDSSNSQGGSIKKIYGVDLIAGNSYKTLQPMVMGENLRVLLEKVINELGETTDSLAKVIMFQMVVNQTFAAHMHIQPLETVLAGGVPIPSFPSAEAAVAGSLVNLQLVTEAIRKMFGTTYTLAMMKLKHGITSTPAFNSVMASQPVLSKYHRLN